MPGVDAPTGLTLSGVRMFESGMLDARNRRNMDGGDWYGVPLHRRASL